ncbi:MAG: transglycosylase SLT domain-containing protein [Dehalococcoidia bacterium]
MRIGATPPSALPEADAARQSAAGAAAPNAPSFSDLLAQRLREPRDQIELTREALRAAIDASRPGAAAATGATPPPTTEPPRAANTRGWSSDGADSFGWRAMTRKLGDEIVGPGFGKLFEAQIQQESGFDPEVAFGYRRSSAGAEGIAQLMPQYYAGVDRRDPEASLTAAAQTMRHYLAANDGDVRRALASYNAGLGTVQSLVAAHGARWERGLPNETKQYLANILGAADPGIDVRGGARLPFGGRGPHGVLSSPLDAGTGRFRDGSLEFGDQAGATVRSPADAVVTRVEGAPGAIAVRLDHGNGWTSLLGGLETGALSAGDLVRRGQAIGALGSDVPLRLSLQHDGRAVDPRAYLLDVSAAPSA